MKIKIPDMRVKVKKKHIIMLLILIVLATAGIYMKKHIYLESKENGTAISIIGGADGSTSIFLAGKSDGEDTMRYTSITMDMAKEIFKNDGSYIILDVRHTNEFAEGHIPGAFNIANEDIGNEELKELPDKDQMIYVYCRSGRRSKEAALKLVELGYTNVIECGGILDWTGDIER